jgi:hypothetical protein
VGEWVRGWVNAWCVRAWVGKVGCWPLE